MDDRQQRLSDWMSFVAAACLVFCGSVSSAGTSLAGPAADALRMDTVLRGCASFGGSITTCSGEFKVEVEDDRRGGRIAMPQALTGTWAVSRERFREESVAVYPGLSQEELARLEAEMERAGAAERPSHVGAPTTRRRVVLFDGSRGIIQEYADGELGLNQPLNGGEAGPTALGACDFADWLGLPAVSGIERPRPPMLTSEYAPRIAGRESIGGVECIKILGGRPRGGWSYMWWTAPEYGYLVMRVDMVRYPPRDSVDAGQLVVMRRRVEEVRAFGKDVWLPTTVEKVTAKVRPDGSLVRVFRRERFTTTNMSVNEPVDESLWDMPELDHTQGDGHDSTEGIGACGYHATLDFCAIMDAQLDDLDLQDLGHLYSARHEATFCDMAADLEAILGLPVAGYHGTLEEVKALNQPVIAHLVSATGRGHFIVIDRIGEGWARVLDGGHAHMMPLSALKQTFTGNVLAVDTEDPQYACEPTARASCSDLWLSGSSSPAEERDRSTFTICNLGTSTLKLLRHFSRRADHISVSLPPDILPGSCADIVVHCDAPEGLPETWTVSIATNDPLRPVLWLGSLGPRTAPPRPASGPLAGESEVPGG